MIENLKSMPAAGIIIIIIILIMFAVSLVLLFATYGRYKRLAFLAGGRGSQSNPFLIYVSNEFAAAYKSYGTDVNTPAIINDAIGTRLSFSMFCERYLNNAVSLFVTLGLFGTFLGLSLSVGSLTKLIGSSNTAEWLSVLDSVGEGLMSALSGMGVAFYTSLVGVACSIILTILRAIISTSAARESLEVRLELWLDHTLAPTLPTDTAKDETELAKKMIQGLEAASESMRQTLKATTYNLQQSLNNFNQTVESFNSGVTDFKDLNYSIQGTAERLDVAMRNAVSGLREAAQRIERSSKA